MTEKEWFEKYYTSENRQILDTLKVIKFGAIIVEIHNEKPVNMWPCHKIRLQKGKNNATDIGKLQLIFKER